MTRLEGILVKARKAALLSSSEVMAIIGACEMQYDYCKHDEGMRTVYQKQYGTRAYNAFLTMMKEV